MKNYPKSVFIINLLSENFVETLFAAVQLQF